MPWPAAFFRPLLLPFREKRCPACLEPFSGAARLCPACLPALTPRRAGFCPDCGEIHPDPHSSPAPCARCISEPPPWASFRFYACHDGLMRQLLLAAKYHCDSAALHLLGQLMAELCAPLFTLPKPPSLLIPMPLHPARLEKRGFNQCQELARPLAKSQGLPLLPQALHRTLLTRPQVGLPRKQRLINPAGAFHALPRLIAGKSILLLDDTCTTGSSLRYAVQALLQAKAAAVHVAVLARTSRHW